MQGGQFTTKKIDSLTLGERMKKIRSERRLSLAEISKATKIQTKYLEYLEEGLYEKLPADVYVKGFLKSYADYLGISEKSLMRQYERESSIRKNIGKTQDYENVIKPLKLSSWRITPRLAISVLVILLMLGGFVYLYHEVDKFISEPKLVLITPMDGELINNHTVTVSGFVDPDSRVFINEQAIGVNENGEFKQDVSLQNGPNSIVVRVINKFNKESTRSLAIQAKFDKSEVQPSVLEEKSQDEKQKIILAEITVRNQPVWISVKADGNIVFSGTIEPQQTQSFEAKEEIRITSANGKNTFVKINGEDKGSLSQKDEVVRDAVFLSEVKSEG